MNILFNKSVVKRVVVASLSAVTVIGFAYQFAQADDSVFLDEGNGDFEQTPIAPEAPAAKPASKPEDSVADAVLDSAAQTVSEASDPWAEAEKPSKSTPPKQLKAKKPAAKAAAGVAAKAGAGRFMTTQESCPMLREPASTGEKMFVVKPSKKIWVEEVDTEWVRGFNKNGEPGYISRGCVN